MADWFKTSDGWWLNLEYVAFVKERNDTVTCDLDVRFAGKYEAVHIHDPADMTRLRRRLDAAAGEERAYVIGLATRECMERLQTIANKQTDGWVSGLVHRLIAAAWKEFRETDGQSAEGD